jgi:hypothetical protein
MATRSRGPSAGFSWLISGIGAAFRHPMPLFGGAGLVVLAILIPTLITLPLQFHALRAGTSPDPATFGLIMGISVLFGLLILPIYAGYLQVVDAAERGLPARAGDIIKPYRDGSALRLIGYGLVMMVAYLAVLAIIILTTGAGVAHWYMEVLAAQASHEPPPTSLPDGFGITLLLCLVFGLFMMGFYSIGLGQVSLRNRSVFGAIGDGAIGALKNLLPLLMLTLGLILAWIVVAIGVGIVVAVLALLARLISVWLMFVVIIPIYIALILVALAAMFGVMYHLWRDVCGDDMMAGMADTVAA